MPRSLNRQLLRHLCGSAALSEGGDMPDGRLLEKFISRRDEDAFQALVRRHGPMVFGVCRRILRQEQDAEDAFQATFLVLARKASSLRRREQLANWLYGVAYRTALDARRRTFRQRAKEQQVEDMPQPTSKPDELWHDLRPVLDDELSRLPDRYRLPIVLCDLEGRTRKEAARHLGVPAGTLSNRLAAARQTLARRLTRRGLALAGPTLAAVLAAERSASAGVPAALVVSIARAATGVAAGGAAVAAVPASVAALTEGVMKAMFLSKLKTTTAVLLLVGFLGAAAAGLAFRADAQEQPTPRRTAGGSQAVPAPDQRPELEKELREIRAELGKMRAEIDKLKEQLGQPGTGRKPVPAEKDGKDKVVKVYPVSDLVNPDETDDLVQLISKTIEPKNWTPTGASIHFFAKIDGLVVSQTPENHVRVQALLDSLRKGKAELKRKQD
jgi:RNA polymerase sigma factor (sigma-70 family)